ncbi:MAG: adenylate/guanylate cyclase domain-containing protein [Marinospirillum sp.]|uniref:CHASE2 domain-containing protein n=1 Tax=Marinospirillum sp. TaxID=2183934 RepID=UPI001A0CCC9F|nr:adenylate/guanylate cyclase domain-containing protein [Marinospirillum sp.]MBE0508697.1 adenylate/guanylate cyclase domain-containing protein [Marinospirillum sp.]
MISRISAVKSWQYLVSVLLMVLVLGEMAGFWPLKLVQRLEWLGYDLRVQATLSHEHDPSIVIVDLDERSLGELGQWPWPREVVAALIEQLFEGYGIGLLGMDIVFAEPEGSQLLLQWQRLRESYQDLPEVPPFASGDEILAEVMARYPVVTGYYFQSRRLPGDPPSIGQLPPPVNVDAPAELINSLPWPRPERYSSNLAVLQQAALGGGFFDNPFVDGDGVFRRVPVLQQMDGELYANLPLAMIYQLLGQPPLQLHIAQGGGLNQLEGVDVGGFLIPTDARGSALVPWYGQRGHFTYVSAADVLSGEADPALLEGALVIFGASAPGLMDLRSTPVQSVYPGPEINASLLAGILHQSYRAEPAYSLAAGLFLLGALGLAITFIFPHLKSIAVLLVSTLLVGAHVGINLWSWQSGWVLPLAPSLLLLLMLAGWHLVMNFWRESREKGWVTERFGQYVPPELVEEMVDTPESFGLEGEERELTVLFSDVRGFTSFSEGIPPSELTGVMNRLLTPITRAIHANKGTIDKYMGDAVMAFWGAPLRDPQHARHALDGAFAMLQALKEINEEFTAEGMKPLAMGIGLNTGPMNVGNMGSEFRMAYTVMGDNVNLGSRLEGLTKAYGVDMIVSETTAAAVPEYLYRTLDKVQVKGRSAAVTILEPLGLKEQIDAEVRHWQQRFEQALQVYLQARFAEAEVLFHELSQYKSDDKLAKIYLERIAHYQSEPPSSDWEGVWIHTEK